MEASFSDVLSPNFRLTPEQLAALPHDDLGPTVLVIVWLLTFAAFGFLALRVYCKIFRRRGLWWDDWILIAAWVSLLGNAVFAIFTVQNGFGKHTYDIPPEKLLRLPLWGNLAGTFSILAVVWSKTSFAITLLRITQDWTKRVVWAIIFAINAVILPNAFIVWLACSPVEKSWNPLVEGTCADITQINKFTLFGAVFSGCLDIVLALLPWKILWSLHMRRKEKIGVAVAMSMGVFAGTTALIKATQIHTITAVDIFEGVQLVIWGTAEGAITIMAASVPILRALLKEASRQPRIQEPSGRLDIIPDDKSSLRSFE